MSKSMVTVRSAKCMRPGCNRPAKNRGLCYPCYCPAGRLVRAGMTTWPRLVAAGKCTAGMHNGNNPGPARLWFLDGNGRAK